MIHLARYPKSYMNWRHLRIMICWVPIKYCSHICSSLVDRHWHCCGICIMITMVNRAYIIRHWYTMICVLYLRLTCVTFCGILTCDHSHIFIKGGTCKAWTMIDEIFWRKNKNKIKLWLSVMVIFLDWMNNLSAVAETSHVSTRGPNVLWQLLC